MCRSPHSPARLLKNYIEDLTGFRHVHCPDGLNTALFSQSHILETGSQYENGEQNVYSKDSVGGKELLMPRSSSWVNGGYVLLMTSSNTKFYNWVFATKDEPFGSSESYQLNPRQICTQKKMPNFQLKLTFQILVVSGNCLLPNISFEAVLPKQFDQSPES